MGGNVKWEIQQTFLWLSCESLTVGAYVSLCVCLLTEHLHYLYLFLLMWCGKKYIIDVFVGVAILCMCMINHSLPGSTDWYLFPRVLSFHPFVSFFFLSPPSLPLFTSVHPPCLQQSPLDSNSHHSQLVPPETLQEQ